MKIELTRDEAIEFRDILVDLIHKIRKDGGNQPVLGIILGQLLEQIEGPPSNTRVVREEIIDSGNS